MMRRIKAVILFIPLCIIIFPISLLVALLGCVDLLGQWAYIGIAKIDRCMSSVFNWFYENWTGDRSKEPEAVSIPFEEATAEKLGQILRPAIDAAYEEAENTKERRRGACRSL